MQGITERNVRTEFEENRTKILNYIAQIYIYIVLKNAQNVFWEPEHSFHGPGSG